MGQMDYVDRDGCEVLLGTGGLEAPVVYVVDLPEHPFDVVTAAAGRPSCAPFRMIWRRVRPFCASAGAR